MFLRIIALFLLISSISSPALAIETNAFTKTGSAIVSAPLGGFFGGVRGAATKSIDYANGFSNELGDGAIAKLLGVPSGFISGFFAGGISGIINGVVKGIGVSMDDPFSDEAFSLDGEFTEYDPYEFFN